MVVAVTATSADPNAADWITAWATVGGVLAAGVAGFFAFRPWRATKETLSATRASLATAREALAIEDARRAEERIAELARARAVASRLAVGYHEYEEPREGDVGFDTRRHPLAVNNADEPFEDLKFEFLGPPDSTPIRIRIPSFRPGEQCEFDFNIWRGQGWTWTVRFSDLKGRRWIRKETDNDAFLVQVDETPAEDLPTYRTDTSYYRPR